MKLQFLFHVSLATAFFLPFTNRSLGRHDDRMSDGSKSRGSAVIPLTSETEDRSRADRTGHVDVDPLARAVPKEATITLHKLTHPVSSTSPASTTITSAEQVTSTMFEPSTSRYASVSITATLSVTPIPSMTVTSILTIATTLTAQPATISFPATTFNTATITNAAGVSVKTCFRDKGGVSKEGVIEPGCGGVQQHFENCFYAQGPWTNPYNTAQSKAFQACFCQTSADEPFNITGPLVQSLKHCADCLILTGRPDYSWLAEMMERLDSFCCSQNPVAYIVVEEIKSWMDPITSGTVLSLPGLTGSITALNNLRTLYTTNPPLANLAYGDSAAGWGRLAGSTPAMTTYTVSWSGQGQLQTVTELVTWLPMEKKGGGEFNPTSAAHSQSAVVSQQLQSAKQPTETLCSGRGWCWPLSSAGARPPLPTYVWISGVAIAVFAGVS